MLDPRSGQASFVILDAEVAGSGHAMLVVPYQALRMSSSPTDKRQSVVLDLRADKMRAAPQIQDNQWQVLQNPQFLDQARNFYQARTYTAARPIDNTSMPAPSLPVVYQPSVDSSSGLTQEQVDFYSE